MCSGCGLRSGFAPLYETRDRLLRLNVQRFHDIKPIIALRCRARQTPFFYVPALLAGLVAVFLEPRGTRRPV